MAGDDGRYLDDKARGDKEHTPRATLRTQLRHLRARALHCLTLAKRSPDMGDLRSRPADLSRYRPRAFVPLPQPQLQAGLGAEAPLLSDRRKASSTRRCARPEIQVHRGAPAAVPC
jgi:hypothetical protein